MGAGGFFHPFMKTPDFAGNTMETHFLGRDCAVIHIFPLDFGDR